MPPRHFSPAAGRSADAARQNRRLAARLAHNRPRQSQRESEIAKRVSHKKCNSYTGDAKAVAIELARHNCRAWLQDAALGKLFRSAVAQNPSMSTPDAGQLYFLEKRRALGLLRVVSH